MISESYGLNQQDLEIASKEISRQENLGYRDVRLRSHENECSNTAKFVVCGTPPPGQAVEEFQQELWEFLEEESVRQDKEFILALQKPLSLWGSIKQRIRGVK